MTIEITIEQANIIGASLRGHIDEASKTLISFDAQVNGKLKAEQKLKEMAEKSTKGAANNGKAN